MLREIDDTEWGRCERECPIEPAGMFFCTAPGYVCPSHGHWGTMSRSAFKKRFKTGFNEFVRDQLGVEKYTLEERGQKIQVTHGSNGMFMSGQRTSVSGSSKDRRKQRRATHLANQPITV